MNTINDKKEKDPLEWDQWGKKGTKPPKIKEYAELLIKFNSTAIDSFKEAKEKLIKLKEEQKNG